jgi:hypothetical protein
MKQRRPNRDDEYSIDKDRACAKIQEEIQKQGAVQRSKQAVSFIFQFLSRVENNGADIFSPNTNRVANVPCVYVASMVYFIPDSVIWCT